MTPSPVPEPQITCRALAELATDYQERALPEEQVDLVEAHLVRCDGCRTYLVQLQLTVEVTGALIEEPPAEVLQTMVAAFRARPWR